MRTPEKKISDFLRTGFGLPAHVRRRMVPIIAHCAIDRFLKETSPAWFEKIIYRLSEFEGTLNRIDARAVALEKKRGKKT